MTTNQASEIDIPIDISFGANTPKSPNLLDSPNPQSSPKAGKFSNIHNHSTLTHSSPSPPASSTNHTTNPPLTTRDSEISFFSPNLPYPSSPREYDDSSSSLQYPLCP